MATKKNLQDIHLDEYEQEIEDHFENAERLSPDEEQAEMKIAKAAAHYTRRKKEERINIRVFANDLQKIKEIAEDEGLAYQTLITSILHKFAMGRLKDSHHR